MLVVLQLMTHLTQKLQRLKMKYLILVSWFKRLINIQSLQKLKAKCQMVLILEKRQKNINNKMTSNQTRNRD